MNGRGRPLRFLALVVIGWVGVRVTMLWPRTGSLTRAITRAVPLVEAPVIVASVLPLARKVSPRRVPPMVWKAGGVWMPVPAPSPVPQGEAALLGLLRYGRPEVPAPGIATLPEAAQPVVAVPSPDRWSASIWMVARPGSGLGAAPGAGQLGGSQAGLRLAWMAVPEKRIAAFARISAPLQGKGTEGAIGLEWQPAHAPVRLVAEQRFGLDGGRGGIGLGMIAGVDVPVPGDFRLEAYGQAGAIRRAGIEAYADGAARATHVVAEEGGVRLSIGAGAWGAAQRDAERLDLGPSVMLGVPVGGRNVRIALDWRQRVAGDARPGSGPALTLGGDF